MQYYWGASFLVIAGLAALAIRSFTRPDRETAVSRLATRMALPVTEEVGPFVLRHAAARSRALALGALAGAIVGICVAPLLVHPMEQMVFILIAVEAIGTTTALCIVSLRSIEPQRPAGVARAAAVGIEDYVSPAYRASVGIAVAAAIVLFSVTTRIRGFDVVICITLVLMGVSFVVAEVAGRRLVAGRQPADSDIELAWNDALRAQLVRDLYGSPIGLGIGVVMLSAVSIVTPGLIAHLLPILTLALTAILLLGAVVSQQLALDRHVLRRLWPAQLKSGWYR